MKFYGKGGIDWWCKMTDMLSEYVGFDLHGEERVRSTYDRAWYFDHV